MYYGCRLKVRLQNKKRWDIQTHMESMYVMGRHISCWQDVSILYLSGYRGVFCMERVIRHRQIHDTIDKTGAGFMYGILHLFAVYHETETIG